MTTFSTSTISDLYEQYRAKVFRQIYYRTGENVQLAEDMTGEVFIRAGRALERGIQPAYPTSWLYYITHNLIVDHLRSNHSRPVIASLDVCEAYVGECGELDACEASADLAQLLARAHLTPLQFEVTVRYWLMGLSAAEIGEHIGCETGAVKGVLHRALVKLRKAARA